jgi:hypothetical protein
VKKLLFGLAVLALTLSISTDASAWVEAEARYWFPTLDSNFQSSDLGVIGTNIDLVKDLGLDEDESFYEGRVTLNLGKHRLRYGFMPLEWDATDASRSFSIDFNGKNYASNIAIDTTLKADYHRLGYEYDFIDVLNNRFGVIFEVKYFDFEASLKSSVFNEAEKLKAPIPTIGIAAQVGLPSLFSIAGEVTGIGLGSDLYLYDAEVGVVLTPAPFIRISAGYRIFELHIEDDDDEATLTLSGPYVMLKADF